MRYLVEAVLNPFFIAFVLLIIGTLLVLLSKSRRKARYPLLAAVLLLFVFSTGWLPDKLSQYLESGYPIIHTVQPTAPYVVVLSGGQSQETGMPANIQLNAASQQRLWEGLRLIRQLPHATLILSGGGYSPGEKPEALQLGQLSQWCRVDGTRIQLEKSSRNTREQAIALKKIIGQQPFYLVTSAIHMPRAMYTMQQRGMHPIAAPTDFINYWRDERWSKKFIPNPYNLVYSTIVLHELLGRAYYSLLNSTS